jgi:hypothetical protein
MTQVVKVSVLGLFCLTLSALCAGQTPQTRDRRLERAQEDIALLKRVVKEQDRRIAELESVVKALQAGTVAERPADGGDRPKAAEKNAPAVPWQIPFAWTRIKEGMSRAQVQEILGAPTSVDSVIDYQTLNYKGDVPGAGQVSGSVRLADDRVAQVNPPVF